MTEVAGPARSDLESRVRGPVLWPNDPHHDAARRLWNAEIDRSPAGILRPLDADDVVAGLSWARDRRLPVSVRGGGHHVAGAALCDGLVIDLALMRDVVVDPEAGVVTVGGGATWAEVDAATQAHGLVVPGGVMSRTGVGGLTLGGGLGWLRRWLGLSSDQLVALDVVTGDGEVRRVDPGRHPDLFRALRGGGGGLGVVTSFEFALHRLGPEVLFGLTVYPADRGLEVLRSYRTLAAEAPDEVTTSVLMGHVPPTAPYPEADWGRAFVAIAGMYAGDPARGQEVLAPFAGLAGVPPLVDLGGRRPYCDVQRMFDASYPDGGHYYWTSLFLDGLPDEALVAALESAAVSPSPASVVAFWQLGGAIDRADAGASAYDDRGAAFLMGVEANFASADPGERATNVDWARGCVAGMAPYSTGRRYVNLPGADDASPAPAAVRARYDPHGVFVVPGRGGA